MKQVYFNHNPWNIHPVYQEMLNNSPKWIEYINKNDFWNEYQKTAINNNKNSILNKIKNFILEIIKKYYFLPNITFRKLPWDIIYSCQSIPLFWDYILDLDCYESLNRFSNKISENFLNKIILKFFLKQKRCKKIIFWSNNAKTWFQSYLGNSFNDKLEVIYPSIKVNHTFEDILSWKDWKNINILFVWRYFERKWWIFLLEAANRIIEKYNNINFFIISDVDKNTMSKYNHKNIQFLWLLNRESTLNYFKKSDIYLMPTYYDLFWYVFIESIAYWNIPISLDDYCINEIIDDWKDWFIIEWFKEKYFNKLNYKRIDKYLDLKILESNYLDKEKSNIINKIVDKLEFLINNKDVKNNFILNWFEKVKNWKFSIELRNKKILWLF